jgi:hypothetical protein
MPSSIRDEPNLRGCPEFGGKYKMMALKNRPGKVVKIPPTPTTFILPGPFPRVTIRPDFQRTAIGAFHPFLPPLFPQVFQAIFPTWEKNLPYCFTFHPSTSFSHFLFLE